MNIEECPICIRVLCEDNTTITLQCNHKYCRECLKQWVTKDIKNNKCLFCMKDIGIKHLSDLRTLPSYYNPVITKYYCTNIDCRLVFDVEDKNTTQITCLECKIEYCFKCKTVWHPNISCDENKSQTVLGHNCMYCHRCKDKYHPKLVCNMYNKFSTFKLNSNKCIQCHREIQKIKRRDGTIYVDNKCMVRGKMTTIVNQWGHTYRRENYPANAYENYELLIGITEANDHWIITKNYKHPYLMKYLYPMIDLNSIVMYNPILFKAI